MSGVMEGGAQISALERPYNLTKGIRNLWIRRVTSFFESLGLKISQPFETHVTSKTLVLSLILFVATEILALKAVTALEVSGLCFALIFIFLTRNIESEFRSAVHCLASTKSIEIQRDSGTKKRGPSTLRKGDKGFTREFSDCVDRIMKRSNGWFVFSMAVFFILAMIHVVMFFWKYFENNVSGIYDVDIIFYFLCSAMVLLISTAVGARLGRMACLGFRLVCYLGCESESYRIQFKPKPGHADGKCGLKAINSFFVFQIECTFFLFFYILFWCFVFIKQTDEFIKSILKFIRIPENFIILPVNTDEIAILFLVGLVVVFILQVFGILSPIMGIRKVVLAERDRWREEVEPTSQRILELRRNLRQEMSKEGKDREDIKFEIEEGAKLVRDVESMGYWPLSWDSLRPIMLFSFELTMVIVPIVLKARG